MSTKHVSITPEAHCVPPCQAVCPVSKVTSIFYFHHHRWALPGLGFYYKNGCHTVGTFPAWLPLLDILSVRFIHATFRSRSFLVIAKYRCVVRIDHILFIHPTTLGIWVDPAELLWIKLLWMFLCLFWRICAGVCSGIEFLGPRIGAALSTILPVFRSDCAGSHSPGHSGVWDFQLPYILTSPWVFSVFQNFSHSGGICLIMI